MTNPNLKLVYCMRLYGTIRHFVHSNVLHRSRGTFKEKISLPTVLCGTLKQEVDTEEEEAALFDNTKCCKDSTKYDT